MNVAPHPMATKRNLYSWNPITLILFCIWILISGDSFAEQASNWICSKNQATGNSSNPCTEYELHVTIQTGIDAGKFGAFGIFAQHPVNNNRAAFWTLKKGWNPYIGGIMLPVDGQYNSLPKSQEYVIYRGKKEDICKLANGLNFDVIAGYGVLTPENKKIITEMNVGAEEASILRQKAIQSDALMSQKGGVVFSQTCERD